MTYFMTALVSIIVLGALGLAVGWLRHQDQR